MGQRESPNDGEKGLRGCISRYGDIQIYSLYIYSVKHQTYETLGSLDWMVVISYTIRLRCYIISQATLLD